MDSTESTAKALLGEVFPEIARRGHLATSRTTDLICECGKAFRGVIWVKEDGTQVIPRCLECRAAENKRLELETWKSQLKELEKNNREDWKMGSQIPTRFDNTSFSNFDQHLQPKAYNAMAAAQDGKISVILSSPGLFGVGKTHLCCALVNHLMETKPAAVITGTGPTRLPCPVTYYTENALLRRFRDAFQPHPEETESEIYQELRFLDVLIIDDVGKVRPRDANYLQSVWFEIVDSRYGDERPLILATNLSLPELETHIGGACADRLREMCGKNIVVMSGASQRHQKSRRG